MKRNHKVLIAAAAIVGLSAPMAAPAFASTVTPNAVASQFVFNGCVTSAQLETAAATAMANWSSNEAALGTSTPAGLTINGQWFPANLVAEAPWPVGVFTCPAGTAPAGPAVTAPASNSPVAVVNAPVTAFNAAASQAVLTGCVTPTLLIAAAALTITNWAINEAALGTSTPAGVTVNGQWYPANLLLSGATREQRHLSGSSLTTPSTRMARGRLCTPSAALIVSAPPPSCRPLVDRWGVMGVSGASANWSGGGEPLEAAWWSAPTSFFGQACDGVWSCSSYCRLVSSGPAVARRRRSTQPVAPTG